MQTVTTVNEGSTRKTVQTGLTAAGTNQASAFGLSGSGFYEFASVAAGAGVQLPSIPTPGVHEIEVWIPPGPGLIVYPPSGGSINSLGTNNPVPSPPASSQAELPCDSGKAHQALGTPMALDRTSPERSVNPLHGRPRCLPRGHFLTTRHS